MIYLKENMQQKIFSVPKSIKQDSAFTFCPGCDHGVALKLVAQVIDELELQEDTIAVASSGCSVLCIIFWT